MFSSGGSRAAQGNLARLLPELGLAHTCTEAEKSNESIEEVGEKANEVA